MKNLLAVVFVTLFAFMTGCSDGTDGATTPPAKFQSLTSEGVVLYRNRGAGDGWIENTNAYPVRIQRVWQENDWSRFGELTEAIDRLDAGEKLILSRLRYKHGFYIYTMDGALVGWLSGAMRLH